MGWSADQGGRPAIQLGLPTFPFFCWVVLGSYLSMACFWAFVVLDFFSGGPSGPCYVRVTVLDRIASCSLADKGMIALHF